MILITIWLNLIDVLLIDTRQQRCIMYQEKVGYYFNAPILLIIMRSAELSFEFHQFYCSAHKYETNINYIYCNLFGQEGMAMLAFKLKP